MLSANLSSPVRLAVTTLPSDRGRLQTLAITLTRPQELIKPEILPTLPLPSTLDDSREVVIYGRSPAWLYGYLIARYPSVPWLGTYDVRSKSIVVIHSRVSSPTVGEQILIDINRQPCPAILVGGPPNSGKSVLSNAIRLSLTQQWPQATIFLHRASWDGEGNWTYETGQAEFVDALVSKHEYRIHEDPETAKLIPGFFQYHADAVKNLRDVMDCLIVDVGGLPQPEKIPIVQHCTHYIVISRLPEAINAWHDFGQPYATPLTVIHSVLTDTLKIFQTSPWLEIESGPWIMGQTEMIPDCLLQHILRHITLPDTTDS